MTSFYDDMRSTADELIAEFGMSGLIRRRSTSTGQYEPDPAQTVSDHPCKLVVTDYSLRERDGTVIRAQDRKVLVAMSGLDITPASVDQIVVSGDVYEIISVMPLSPGGVVLLYEIQARA